jgi:hypothetical protein
MVINGTEDRLAGHNYQNTNPKSQQNQTIRNTITTEYTSISEPIQTHKIRDSTVKKCENCSDNATRYKAVFHP